MLHLSRVSSLPSLQHAPTEGFSGAKQHQLARTALQIITTPGKLQRDSGQRQIESNILSAVLRRKFALQSQPQDRPGTRSAADHGGTEKANQANADDQASRCGADRSQNFQGAEGHTTSATLIAAFNEIWGEWGLGVARRRKFCHISCGDGQIVLDLCRAFPTCQALGLELDAELLKSARAYSELQGLTSRCDFQVGLGGEGSLADATAVLLSDVQAAVKSAQAMSHLGIQRGTLVVSIGRPLLPEADPALSPLLFHAARLESRGLFCYFWTGKELPPRGEEVQEGGACPGEKEAVDEAPRISEDRRLASSASSQSLPVYSSTPCTPPWRSPSHGAMAQQTLASVETKAWPIRRPRKITWAQTIWVRPKQILFTRPCISERFSCGRLVQDTIDGLRSETVSPADIPRISVVRQAGRLLTLDHRRLFAFQQGLSDDAEIEVGIVEGDFYPDRGIIPQKCSTYQAVQVERVRDRFTYWAPCAGVDVYPKT
mmetsp:Transcript_42050/g.78667  ORF Transcript_42050/g.78667 Transcript_42050/m.78667 type:complete len:488 (-) Transcript_42050:21-1484(-)